MNVQILTNLCFQPKGKMARCTSKGGNNIKNCPKQWCFLTFVVAAKLVTYLRNWKLI